MKMPSRAATHSTSRSKSGQWSPLTGTNLHLRRSVKRLSRCWRGRSLGAGGHAAGRVPVAVVETRRHLAPRCVSVGASPHTLSHSLSDRPGTGSGCAGTRSCVPRLGLSFSIVQNSVQSKMEKKRNVTSYCFHLEDLETVRTDGSRVRPWDPWRGRKPAQNQTGCIPRGFSPCPASPGLLPPPHPQPRPRLSFQPSSPPAGPPPSAPVSWGGQCLGREGSSLPQSL